ncbi:MAG: hypothetical protein IJC58_00850 [Oscillospiraceae bacterium]|nr:hypothetical protein [Oscillospiraceae bacterium]
MAEFMGFMGDLEEMTRDELQSLMEDVLHRIDELNEREPRDLESEEYEEWSDRHEELEDLMDEILDLLED